MLGGLLLEDARFSRETRTMSAYAESVDARICFDDIHTNDVKSEILWTYAGRPS